MKLGASESVSIKVQYLWESASPYLSFLGRFLCQFPGKHSREKNCLDATVLKEPSPSVGQPHVCGLGWVWFACGWFMI